MDGISGEFPPNGVLERLVTGFLSALYQWQLQILQPLMTMRVIIICDVRVHVLT
jgi:RNA polymerase sigma-70 factor (ECF subfamily)